ncbi:MAG TPA: hypothetical protein VLA16_05160, partial [Ideonella sp.]|nr:hypothetical protein [Ideonella sp.]
MLDAAPQDTRALVVGIDHYAYGTPWRLAGPADDALRCVDWLLDRGMEAKHIALFLARASWEQDPAVAVWSAAHPAVARFEAGRDLISAFVDKTLPKMGGSGLIVYWGGHGVIDDQLPRRNYLYTEDAGDGLPYCVCVQDLMAALQGERFAHLAQQVAIFDACANPFSDSGETGRAAPASFAQPGATDNGIQQTQMFAASLGTRASNLTELKSGLFSNALFQKLKMHAAPGWPDFVQAFHAALDDVAALKLKLQAPYLVIDVPGGGEFKLGKPPGASAQVEQLLSLVDDTGVSPAVVYRLYLRSLADSTRRLETRTIAELLKDLANLPPRAADYPGPLVEFAERLARELRARPVHHQALAAWVSAATRDAQNARTALQLALDTEAGAQRPRATL